ncbi:MAG: tRNA (adenosine(37)-N6)-dimethylallyltransferase MiaA [Phycisphaerae bacterium]|nr:tRNA (adenosine(37)-N6)-dimethylallyltransferase MiaA [Phycisphaerae bacterium]
MDAMSDRPGITVILGVTACGKSAVAMELARARGGGEILSVDSMQVYRRMDIGTAKPTPAEQAATRHHLIDVVEPSETFSAARYVQLAESAIADMHSRFVPILAVGGTSLYLKALAEGLFEGPPADAAIRSELHERAEREGAATLHAELAAVDPQAGERIHPNDLRRIVRAIEVHRLTGLPISQLQQQFGRLREDYAFTFVGLRRDPDEESRRINERVKLMVRQGLVEETQRLLTEPAGLSRQARQALGYAQIVDFIEGRLSLTKAVEQIKVATRQFAKHQRTWFRRFPGVRWIDLAETISPREVAERIDADLP